MIEFDVSPRTVCAEAETELAIVVRNCGSGPCTNVTLQFKLPSGVLLVGGRSHISVPWLGGGEHREYRITVEARRPGWFEVVISNYSYCDQSGQPRRLFGASWGLAVLPAEDPPCPPPGVGHGPGAINRGSYRGNVFISYRWDDSDILAVHLYAGLCRAFGKDSVFLDRARRKLGEDFRQRIDVGLSASTAMLVLIGPHWNPDANTGIGRRLDSDQDIVRYEIRTALETGQWIIPVLFHGATMPTEAELPEDLRPLVYRLGATIHMDAVGADMAELIIALRDHVRPRSRHQIWRQAARREQC